MTMVTEVQGQSLGVKSPGKSRGNLIVGVNPELDALIDGIQDGVPMARMTRLYAYYVLARYEGNKSHASSVLGIDRRTLQRWAKEK